MSIVTAGVDARWVDVLPVWLGEDDVPPARYIGTNAPRRPGSSRTAGPTFPPRVTMSERDANPVPVARSGPTVD